MDRCALFVDAGYLLADGAMAVHGTRHREAVSWDFGGLLQLLGTLARERTGMPLLRCYWYEATPEGRRAPEHEALADLPGLKLRLGRARPGRREGVDNEIHRDLMTLARNGALADAVVVSGDEDLTQVVVDAQDFGVRVTVVHITVDGNWTVSRALRHECDDLVEIGSGQLRPFVNLLSGVDTSGGSSPSPLSNGHGAGNAIGSLHSTGPLSSPPPSSPLTGPPTSPSTLTGQSPSSTGSQPPLGSSFSSGTSSGYDTGGYGTSYDTGSSSGYGSSGYGSSSNGSGPALGSGSSSGNGSAPSYDNSPSPNYGNGSSPSYGNASPSGYGNGSSPSYGNGSSPSMGNGTGSGGIGSVNGSGLGSGMPGGNGNGGPVPSQPPPSQQAPSSPLHAAPTPGPSGPSSTGPINPGSFTGPVSTSSNGTGAHYLPSSPVQPPSQPPPPSHGPYTGPQQISPIPAQQNAPTLSDAVKAAHQEGQDFGESVARDAPALWLEAVLARKPRMPSDLEARLLQGSSLPIDFLLHDEVRHALRRGFWDALERSRR
jgi:hypothetical protein